MPRVNIPRSLPPLKTVIKSAPVIPEGQSRQFVMIETMREVAQGLRTASSQPFYTMREVAEFFQAPVSMIFPVYTALEREGIISRIRSSRTMLNGKVVRAREIVRGVVGIPVGIQSMVLPYTQQFVEQIEVRLGRLGYIADFIFNLPFEDPEGAAALLRRNLDAIIVHSARPHSRPYLLSLCERGIRVLVIQRKDTQMELPGINYLQDYQSAYQAMAARWHQVGIRHVWLNTPLENLYNPFEMENMKSILHQAGLKAEWVADKPTELLERIRQQSPRSLAGVAFLDSIHAELICNCEPDVFREIAQIARLAFCVGHIRLPRLNFRQVRADIIDFSSTEIATRLASDISRLSILPDGICHTFVARYHEQELL